MLRASFFALFAAFALTGCDARLVDAYSTTEVNLRDTPGFGGCTQTQGISVDLLTHTLAYSICTASAVTAVSGATKMTNDEYPMFLSVLESMKIGTSNQVFLDSGQYTADVYDGGDGLYYVEASTATPNPDNRTSAKGVRDAYNAALALVQAHRAAGDTGVDVGSAIVADGLTR